VKVAIAARFEAQKREDEDADENERQGGGFIARKRQRKRNAERDNRPIGGVIEACPPDRTAVDLAAIKMRERPDLGGPEHALAWLLLLRGLSHVAPPRARCASVARGRPARNPD